jgi:SAM-dependent methyltransferase
MSQDDAALRGRGDIPETIDNDWVRFYREYPDIYDRFAITTPPVVDAAHDLVDFTDTVVIDAGSGTGKSTFALAKYARFVYGVEPWEPMRIFAEQRLREIDLSNVTFIDTAAPNLPFVDQSADALVSFYAFPWHFPFLGEPEGRDLGERYLAEAKRVLRPGSYVIATDNAPGWYGGELAALLLPGLDGGERNRDTYMQRLGFAYQDIEVDADYGSVEEAVATYGFIYGRKAIDYLVAHNKQSILWRPRLYYQQV